MLFDLLGKGYFPHELPPPFNTHSYGACFGNPPTIPSHLRKPPKAELVAHNLARAGRLRRRLSIPNPFHHLRLSELIEQNWTAINAHCQMSTISKSKPSLKPKSKRAIMREYEFDDLPAFRASTRAVSRYVLITDIANYYSSLYTHSIPWAIHTKAVAKTNRSHSLYGNVLDQVVRSGQDEQTGGIPISPDSSFVLSEIVLTSIDLSLNEKTATNGFRYMDDYELGFETLSQAEEALAILQSVLHEYDLQLNQSKTSILPLPDVIERPWISELRKKQSN